MYECAFVMQKDSAKVLEMLNGGRTNKERKDKHKGCTFFWVGWGATAWMALEVRCCTTLCNTRSRTHIETVKINKCGSSLNWPHFKVAVTNIQHIHTYEYTYIYIYAEMCLVCVCVLYIRKAPGLGCYNNTGISWCCANKYKNLKVTKLGRATEGRVGGGAAFVDIISLGESMPHYIRQKAIWGSNKMLHKRQGTHTPTLTHIHSNTLQLPGCDRHKFRKRNVYMAYSF